MNSDLWGINDVGFSEKHIFELVETWNGDLGLSDHLWTYFFGSELSGGVLGAGDGMNKYNLLAMLTWAKKHAKKTYFESRFEIWTSG